MPALPFFPPSLGHIDLTNTHRLAADVPPPDTTCCPTCGRVRVSQVSEIEGRLEGNLLEAVARGLQEAYSRTVWRGRVPGQLHGLDWSQMSPEAQESWRQIARQVGQEFDLRLRRAATARDVRPCAGGFDPSEDHILRAPTLHGWCGRPSTHVAKRGGQWRFFCHEHAHASQASEVLTVDDWFSRGDSDAAAGG